MAPGNFMTNILTNDELKSEFRDFKLKSISGEIQFKFNWNRAAQLEEKLDFIQQTFKNDIITGSLALNLLGLIHRESADIDILIDDKDRYPRYMLDDYDDEFSSRNRLGYIIFGFKKNTFWASLGCRQGKKKEYTVDFFNNNYGAKFLEFPFKSGVLRIHNPLEIMDYKIQMAINPKVVSITSRKHNEDLTRIFGQAPWQLALRGEI